MEKRASDRILNVLNGVNDDNLDAVYAEYCNQLFAEVDHGNNEEEREFLKELIDFLETCIVNRYMMERDWWICEHEPHNIWRKEK